ncbi:PEP-CTERM sorting domain-containing protein [bacterium]|nr:MAG: PEP-CTERM sorting domain-containing protein [bacterium]
MTSSSAKSVAVAAALVGTWSTAQADVITSTLTPTLNVDNVHFFNEAYDQTLEGSSPLVDGSTYFSDNLGSIAANGSLVDSNTTEFYNENTSTFAGGFGTSGSSIVASTVGFNQETVNAYLATGSNFEDLYAAITNSQIGPIVAFAGGQGDINANGFDLADLGGTYLEPGDSASSSASLYVFTKTGETISYLDAGTAFYSVSPEAVPEPASMAALGFGALALIRRRRRK